MSKQYGLIIPSKNKGHKIAPVTSSKPSIFNEDSDSDTPAFKPTGVTKSVKKQDKLNQSRAVEEDPTVYQYDEIYDEMDQKRRESKLSRKDLDKKPKYINRLLAAAEKRKRENERRIERQVQKEREEEGEQFKDKESFVTSAYKKKLEEMRELEEQEKREEYLESIGDVRKQGNLDGFYRHLYDQKINYEDKIDEKDVVKKEDVKIKDELKSDSENEESRVTKKSSRSNSEEHGDKFRGKRRKLNENKEKHSKRARTSESLSENEDRHSKDIQSSDNESDTEEKKPKTSVKERKYRAHKEVEDEHSTDEESEVKKEHLVSNLDADSDFSIDSSDSEDEKEEKEEKSEKQEKVEENNLKESGQSDKSEDKKDSVTENDKIKEEVVEVKPKKPKVDIWKKRTVGEIFDEALKRYYERKAIREAGH